MVEYEMQIVGPAGRIGQVFAAELVAVGAAELVASVHRSLWTVDHRRS